MRLLSRFPVHTSARFLEDEYSISYTTILSLDKEVLEKDVLKPELHDVQGVTIDEKYLVPSPGFVTLCLNATTGAGVGTAVVWMTSLTDLSPDRKRKSSSLASTVLMRIRRLSSDVCHISRSVMMLIT